MKQQSQIVRTAKKSRREIVSLVVRTTLFIGTLLAIVVTGIFIMETGATSESTILSVVLSIILGIVSVIQIYPILFPGSSAPPISTKNTSGSAGKAVPSTISTNTTPGQPIFLFNLPLRDANEFYGRVAARTTLIQRTSSGGSSSIIGERRMGKTWLLEYLQLVGPTHNALGSAYRITYISATHPQCKSVNGFVQQALEKLKIPGSAIDRKRSAMGQLSQGVGTLRSLNIVPVLCIDEFDGFNNKRQFDHDFIEGLRALAQDEGLVLVIASKHPLKELIEDLTGQTSPLFNIIYQIRLESFTDHEAKIFVSDKGDQIGFNTKEQDYFLHCSTLYNKNGEPYWPPLLLQLVGQMLLDDKQAAQARQLTYDVDAARYQNDFKQRLDEAYQAVMRSIQ